MKNVVIGICSGDMIHADFAFSLFNMGMFSTIMKKEDHRILGIINRKTSVIHFGRNELVKQALSIQGATHILMVDSDMTVPPSALARLLTHNKPIVGIQASTKRPPFKLTARQEDGKWMVGGGVLLIDLEVFKKLAFPWFAAPYDAEGNLTGEDIYFCRKAWDAGIPVEIDLELSKHIAHLGQEAYGIEQ